MTKMRSQLSIYKELELDSLLMFLGYSIVPTGGLFVVFVLDGNNFIE